MIYAILLAGGIGSRFGGETPKQFLKLDGESLLHRAMRRFRAWGRLQSIVVVVPPGFLEAAEAELSDLLDPNDRIVEGGRIRHESTLLGLYALKTIGINPRNLVCIHDVARPFFLHSELDKLLSKASSYGAASLAALNTDTLVRAGADPEDPESESVKEIVQRKGIYRIKTPQAAEWELLEDLMKVELSEEPTDLCTWCKMANRMAGIVPTGEWNIKITYPEDLKLAEGILTSLKFTHSDFQ